MKHLSAFTDNMQTFLELEDDQPDAPVLQLDFGTTNSTPEPEPPAARRSTRSDRMPAAHAPWTFDDERQLEAGVRFGLDDQELADYFGRSVQAIRRRREHLGIGKVNHGPR